MTEAQKQAVKAAILQVIADHADSLGQRLEAFGELEVRYTPFSSMLLIIHEPASYAVKFDVSIKERT